MRFEPLGGRFFEFFDGLGDGGGSGEAVENVDVVLDGIYENDGPVDCFADGGEVGVEIRADGIGEEGMPGFGREDQVDVDVREGLRHGATIPIVCRHRQV